MLVPMPDSFCLIPLKLNADVKDDFTLLPKPFILLPKFVNFACIPSDTDLSLSIARAAKLLLLIN